MEHQTPSLAVRAATSVMRLTLSRQEALTPSPLDREVRQALTPVQVVQAVQVIAQEVPEVLVVEREVVVEVVPRSLTRLLLPVVEVAQARRTVDKVFHLSEQTAAREAVSQVSKVQVVVVQLVLTVLTVAQAALALLVELVQLLSLRLVAMETLTTVQVVVVQLVPLVLVLQVLPQTVVQAPAVRLEV